MKKKHGMPGVFRRAWRHLFPKKDLQFISDRTEMILDVLQTAGPLNTRQIYDAVPGMHFSQLAYMETNGLIADIAEAGNVKRFAAVKDPKLEDLTADQFAELKSLVFQVANRVADDAVDSGAEVDYLIKNGMTIADVRRALSITTEIYS